MNKFKNQIEMELITQQANDNTLLNSYYKDGNALPTSCL